MGCLSSKEIVSNVRTPPHQIVGSTNLQADQIVVLGDSVFLPTKDPETGESAIIEIEVDNKKMRLYKGYKGRMVREGISL